MAELLSVAAVSVLMFVFSSFLQAAKRTRANTLKITKSFFIRNSSLVRDVCLRIRLCSVVTSRVPVLTSLRFSLTFEPVGKKLERYPRDEASNRSAKNENAPPKRGVSRNDLDSKL
ncbi:MAG TPA: hypothetical protein VN181_03180, partial [Thermoanaerobaculia bacterium]|nr:hypothetical protein [Thermoanaerobaculia bacterium]